jgi:hypothetical protein
MENLVVTVYGRATAQEGTMRLSKSVIGLTGLNAKSMAPELNVLTQAFGVPIVKTIVDRKSKI